MKPRPSHADTYTVRFWAKDAQGYLRQQTEQYATSGKDRHEEAIAHICKKWNIDEVDVINCTYQ